MKEIPLLKMIMVNSMYNRYKILAILFLFCTLSVCAERGVYSISTQNNEPLDCTFTQQDRISDFSDYITNIFHTTSFDLPSSFNFLTERTPVQYSRVRKVFENKSLNFKYRAAGLVAKNRRICFDDTHAGIGYSCAREYFIYTLNRLRI